MQNQMEIPVETAEVMTNELPAELAQVRNTVQLEPLQAETILRKYAPFYYDLAGVKKQTAKIDFQNPSDLDCQIAGTLRKQVVKIRTASKALKDEENRIDILRQKVNTTANNGIESVCKLTEYELEQVEKHREIAQKAAEAALQTERIMELRDFSEFVPQGLNFGTMTETDFANILNGAKLQKQAKIAAEAEAERQRIERETAETAAREIQRKENERLRAEAEQREKDMQSERTRVAAEQAKAKVIADAEFAKQQQIIDAKNKQIAADKAAKDKAEAEAKALRDAEAKRIADAKAKADADRAAELEAQRKAAAASDKDKLLIWLQRCDFHYASEVQNEAGIAVETLISEKFTAFKSWAVQQINNL